MKELVKMYGSFFMCQLCMNLSAWNLKVFSMVSMSRRCSSGKALSVSFPYKVAKKNSSGNVVLFYLELF